MCCNTTPQGYNEVLKRFEAEGDTIVCWKEVGVVPHDIHSIFFRFKWLPGINISSRLSEPSAPAYLQVSHGFHVFYREPLCASAPIRFILPLHCCKEDLIGADDRSGVAVFMQVELKQEDYDHVLEEYERSLVPA
jgi:hypothetical protein